MDDGGGSDSYGAVDDQQSFDPASRFVRHRLVSAVRTCSVLVMFFAWTPFTLLVDDGHTFGGWWVVLLVVWLSCTAFVAVVAAIEKWA
ncbi:hypothetical protein [Dactylosporangium sp. NPDC051541]|uniref:hypothetical protein n=1 Tax=Dactylosporangium sp. NPDC051541 TaxID=3363977 RepID=UPI0037BCB41E